MNKTLWISILILSFTYKLWGQWECPGQLGAYLKPVGKSKLMWAAELTGATGYLTDNSISNTMGLAGIDYSTPKHTFYIEGGFKYWYRNDFDADIKYHQSHLGLRELFYQYRGNAGNFTLGLQSMNLDDNYLLNERVLGLNYKLTTGKWKIDLAGGTVTKDYARNGTFCNVSYLYDIVPGRARSLLGNTLGETNLAGLTLSYYPSKKTKNNTGGDGLSTEFASNLDNDSTKSSKVSLESIGMALYGEFGEWINDPVMIGGFYSKINLIKDFSFTPEILLQVSKNNNAFIYSFKLDKPIVWKNSHRTNFFVSYFGLLEIDNGAQALNSFSNIFAGNVLRLDVPDLPFYQVGIKHTIPSAKIHVKLQASGQAKSNPMQEYDFEFGKKFFHHLSVNGTCGYVTSPVLTDDAVLFRVEMRLDF